MINWQRSQQSGYGLLISSGTSSMTPSSHATVPQLEKKRYRIFQLRKWKSRKRALIFYFQIFRLHSLPLPLDGFVHDEEFVTVLVHSRSLHRVLVALLGRRFFGTSFAGHGTWVASRQITCLKKNWIKFFSFLSEPHWWCTKIQNIFSLKKITYGVTNRGKNEKQRKSNCVLHFSARYHGCVRQTEAKPVLNRFYASPTVSYYPRVELN